MHGILDETRILKARKTTIGLVASMFCMLAFGMVPSQTGMTGRATTSISASDSTADSTKEGIKDSTPVGKARQLTVDSVLNSYTGDSILEMLSAGRVLEVAPDSSKMDTTRRDTIKKSKSALDEPVRYSAKDSITFDWASSRANLYGESKVDYQNLQLEADHISISIDSSVVHAMGREDSAGVVVGPPVFHQGEDVYEPDKISYNFKTQKAFITNVYTEQGEGMLISQESKRDSMGTIYSQTGMYTTCDAKHPHFYLKLTRAKVRPGKDVVFGPAYLVVEDVPLPLAIPYGFFPFSKSYSSGFIMPTYGDETRRGFYLRDGGYYFAINDNVDLKLLGEIYTKGSWGLSAASTYKKRYRYSGNFFFSYQNTKEGDKNMPDYLVEKSFKLTWSHRQDPKANPTQSFSARVNFATTSYERNNLISMYNPESYTQSTRTSSVSYTKTFSNIGLTLTSTFELSQNMRDSTLSLTMPNLTINQSRFNPFKRKRAVGKERWYEKIAASYTGTLSNSITTKEDQLLKSNLIKDWRNGMRHQVPILASFAVLNYINVTPSFNFTDRMYSRKVMQSWDQQAQSVVRDTIYGFNNVYNYNMSVSANTKLYGMYRPMPWFGGKKIMAIRHVFSPTVTFSYAPDFGQSRFGYWDTYLRTDKDGNTTVVSYSPYAGALYGTVSPGKTGSISLDVSNNIEMKTRIDNDSTRKISLIDELGGSLSYNMASKKPWSDLSMRLRLKITKSFTYSLNAVFATYAYDFDKNGNVVVGNHTEWSRGRFGRFQGMSHNFPLNLNSQTFSKLFGKNKGKKGRGDDGDDDDEDEYDDEESDLEDQNVDPDRAKARNSAQKESKTTLDEDGYVKFSMPWSISFSYGINMRENTSGRFHRSRMRYGYKFTHTLNCSGNIRLSEGWNINFSSGYDFNYHRLSMTTASVSRDLHCFTMGCSVVLEPYRSYNFTFACKAGSLADVLRWKKQSSYSSNIEWY